MAVTCNCDPNNFINQGFDDFGLLHVLCPNCKRNSTYKPKEMPMKKDSFKKQAEELIARYRVEAILNVTSLNDRELHLIRFAARKLGQPVKDVIDTDKFRIALTKIMKEESHVNS